MHTLHISKGTLRGGGGGFSPALLWFVFCWVGVFVCLALVVFFSAPLPVERLLQVILVSLFFAFAFLGS